jgi:hypothetical protein
MEVHTVVFWVMTPCVLVGGYKRFCRTYSFHLQGRNTWACDEKNQRNAFFKVDHIFKISTHSYMFWRLRFAIFREPKMILPKLCMLRHNFGLWCSIHTISAGSLWAPWRWRTWGAETCRSEWYFKYMVYFEKCISLIFLSSYFENAWSKLQNTWAYVLEFPDKPIGTSLRVYISSLFIAEEFLPMKKITSLSFPCNLLFMEYNYWLIGKWRTKEVESKEAYHEFELDRLYLVVCACSVAKAECCESHLYQFADKIPQ